MWGRRADRPEGEPWAVEARKMMPVLDEGKANVYFVGAEGKSFRFCGALDTWEHRDALESYQRDGRYLVWSVSA